MFKGKYILDNIVDKSRFLIKMQWIERKKIFLYKNITIHKLKTKTEKENKTKKNTLLKCHH